MSCDLRWPRKWDPVKERFVSDDDDKSLSRPLHDP
jgi:hypothetical protein